MRRANKIAPEWRVWIAENLARGASKERIHDALRRQRVPARDIADAMNELEASPALEAARRLAVAARRHELMCTLHNTLLRTRKAPQKIERRAGVGATELLERYYATNTPVVLTDWVTKWPALTKWTPEHLAERVGGAWIDVTTDRERDPDYDMHTTQHTTRVRLRDFVDRIRKNPRSNDFYAVAQNRNIDRKALAPLWKDVRLDRRVFSSRTKGGAALWLGPAGTVTPLHHDTSNIFFAQLHGRKRFLLASPHETSLWDGARGFYAKGPPEAFPSVLFSKAELRPGDALFLPVGWWHHVEALDVSISFALTCFTRPNWLDWYRPTHLR
ncbi:MAG: cupin-like domain-containing protein [Sandaracinaceae bacterium]|nr:cupin-like domain-containing protein [Sandaracinaceae bacterium]